MGGLLPADEATGEVYDSSFEFLPAAWLISWLVDPLTCGAIEVGGGLCYLSYPPDPSPALHPPQPGHRQDLGDQGLLRGHGGCSLRSVWGGRGELALEYYY